MHTKIDAMTSNQAFLWAAVVSGLAGVGCGGTPSHENRKPVHKRDAGMQGIADSAVDADAEKPTPVAVNSSPVTGCTMAGIGAAVVMADAPVTILDVSTNTAGT